MHVLYIKAVSHGQKTVYQLPMLAFSGFCLPVQQYKPILFAAYSIAWIYCVSALHLVLSYRPVSNYPGWKLFCFDPFFFAAGSFPALCTAPDLPVLQDPPLLLQNMQGSGALYLCHGAFSCRMPWQSADRIQLYHRIPLQR